MNESNNPAEFPSPEPKAGSAEKKRIDLAHPSDEEIERQMRQISRRSFLWGGVALAGSFTAWKWLVTRPMEAGILWPFRISMEANQRLAEDYFRGSRLAPTFPATLAETPKENGDYGLSDDLDLDAWRLNVYGLEDIPRAQASSDKGTASHDSSKGDKKGGRVAASTPSDPARGDSARALTLDDIKKCGERVEMVTQLKCIEGWSVIVQWAGVRFSDFMKKYPPESKKDEDGSPMKDEAGHPITVDYVSLETPDRNYYVGLDMASAMHPQTLLCWEMNGKPLTPEHGAPLRLVIPAKYGIKNIKRIGTIRFIDSRPKDYWAERGYDWYAGH